MSAILMREAVVCRDIVAVVAEPRVLEIKSQSSSGGADYHMIVVWVPAR